MHSMPPSSATPPDASERNSTDRARRGALPWILVGGLAAIATALIVLLLTKPGPDPTPQSTTTATATPTLPAVVSDPPSVTPLPGQPEPPPSESTTAASPTIVFSTAPTSVNCGDGDTTVPMLLGWSTADATDAWIGVGTQNAQAEPFEAVPTTAAAYENLAYPCAEPNLIVTLTAVGPGGIAHHTIEIIKD